MEGDNSHYARVKSLEGDLDPLYSLPEKGDTALIWDFLKQSKIFRSHKDKKIGDKVQIIKKDDFLLFTLTNNGRKIDSLTFKIDVKNQMFRTKRKLKLIPLFFWWDYDERVLFIGSDDQGNLLIKQGSGENFYILSFSGSERRFYDMVAPRLK
jgi:hypothetical protein